MIPLNRDGPAILLRKVRRWLEPKLDPTRPARVLGEFDDQRGYAAWHARCQAALARPLPLRDTPGTLVSRGFAVQQVLSPEAAAKVVASAATGPEQRLKRDSNKLRGYELSHEMLAKLVEAVLTPEVDAHCLEFFRSEYFVYWYTLSRTAPSSRPASVSFRWHCDRGPRAHLKLLVYLNDFSAHGGGTSYLDLEASDAVARVGYTFGGARRRTTSLDKLSSWAGRPLQAYDHCPRAGDAVLFQPSRVLHRGVTPKFGPRDVFTLCLLPSPVHWRVALEHRMHIDLRDDPIWHEHAGQLEQRFTACAV